MSRTYISKSVKDRVAKQARYRCGYCQTQALIIGANLEIEHIIPKAQGGTDDETNLWLACSPCNDIKNDRTEAIDPITKETVPLFNPRTQIWKEHFAWSKDGIKISGLTSIGRATVEALDLNRSPVLVSRKVWVKAGLHPPEDAQ